MKSWRQREQFNAPIVLATLALVGATTITGWSLYAYRNEMQFNLLAELAGVLFEVAVVVLVVDWLVKRRERNRWRHAYPMISDRFATAFTDVMRLLYVAGTQAGYSNDMSRYAEFYRRLTRNVDHLRSTMEGFAVALESTAHYALRDLELKVRWLHDRLEMPSRDLHHEFQVSLETAEEFEQFCMDTWEQDFRKLRASIVEVIERVAPEVTRSSSPIDREQALNLRYRLQTAVLDAKFGKGRLLGALVDYRQEASVCYFVIDRLLLPHHVVQVSRRGDA